MLSYVRWAAAGFALVAACSLQEGTDPGSDASTAGDGGVCDVNTCPGKDNECGQRICTISGACSMAYLPQGPATSAQVPGDCRTDTCDGKGTLASKIDDADIPDDKNPCTKDICTNGVPSHTPGPSGVSCGTGLLCDGGGQCVGCLNPADCPGTDSECGTRTCSPQGVCGNSFAAAGKALSAQVAGDCHVIQCDGNGTAVSVVNNGDVPNDGNACTSDLCILGAPSNPPTGAGSACNVAGKTLCNGAGVCVQCLLAATCAGSDTFCSVRTCLSNVCGVALTGNGTVTPVQITGDCKENQCSGGVSVSVVKPSDLPVDSNDCTSDLCSVAGVPSNPPTASGTPCNVSGNTLCNGSGTCVQCVAPSTCPGGPDTFCNVRTCSVAGVCGFNDPISGTATPTGQTSYDCHQVQCNGIGGTTNAIYDLDKPVDGNDCTDDVCTGGVATNPNLNNNTPCASNGGNKCINGVCVP